MTALTELQPRFPDHGAFLARFLPRARPEYWGLCADFCDLHAFLRHLHASSWYGYLHVAMHEQHVHVLVYEGRVVAAASASNTGELALGDMLSLFLAGGPLSACTLDQDVAHALSGVGSRAWKFDLTEDFTGLHAGPGGATFYARGQVIATMPVTLPTEGAFPAPLRPQTLILPKSLAGWAHQNYALTLRGRDALNPITTVHQQFRATFGGPAQNLVRAISEGLTPAEHALRTDAPLQDLEPLLADLVRGGYVKAVGAR
ncbi:hypothetical protein [Deinococcus pimensis]|uniref:hypothetical protein n=1 Tax=Deinococcus pimensis TaxID=309888 RepID=UPI00048A12E5|nr:hypothetical protein [Deinococcus pimensis]